MNILLKHTLRSIAKSKSQALMIVFTIVIITIMLFVSFSVSDIFYNINIAEYSRVAQGADMLITSDLNGDTFSSAHVEKLLDPNDNVQSEYFLRFNSVMKTTDDSKVIIVEAVDLSEYLNNHTLEFAERWKGDTAIVSDTPYIEYYPVILGETFAKNANISAGDLIEIYVPTYDMYAKLIVLYIAKNTGIFSIGAGVNVLLDFSAIGVIGVINAVYLKFNDPGDYQKYETIFKQAYPELTIEEGNRASYAKEITMNNTLLFVAGLIFIIAVMMLIQLTSYLVISRKRMSEMIIFKASGATPLQVTFIMLVEVLIYALIGLSIGLVAGRLAMQIISSSLLSAQINIISYPFWKYVLSALIAIFVSIAACLSPILSGARKSIRELVAGAQRNIKPTNLVAFVISTVLVIGLAIMLKFITGIGVVIVSCFLIIAAGLFIYLSATPIIKFLSFLFRKLKASGGIAISTLSSFKNKSLRSITILLSTVFAFTFIVASVIDLVKLAVVPYNSRFQSDYVIVSLQKRDVAGYDRIRDSITSISEIKSVGYINFGVLMAPDNPIENLDGYINTYGARDFESVEMVCENLSSDAKERWNSTDHPVIVNSELMIKNNWQIGDTISFLPTSTDFVDYDFTFLIIGIDYSVTSYDRVMYVKITDFSMMFDSTMFLVNIDQNLSTEDEQLLFLVVRDAAENAASDDNKVGQIYALRYDEWAYSGTSDTSKGVSNLLLLLQVAIYLISVLGIINVSIVAIFDRKQELLVYKLSGMTTKNYSMFSLGEASIVAITSSFIGYILAFVINGLLPSMSALVAKYIDFGIFPRSGVFLGLLISLAFVIIWFVVSLLNNKKIHLNSINERLF
ncbi:MAG: ABC transporter permease [Christensenellaceae bacterium]|jgi:ABC-type lipoprotein release transport system permease subunit|nr:ABC transporter permease [Christensenellaceae bacterium]